MKNVDKDTLKELALGIFEMILLVFVIYFVARGYQNSIPLVDLLPIFISAILGGIYMSRFSHTEIDSEEGLKKAKLRFRIASGFVTLGFVFVSLALFVSKKEVNVVPLNVKQVDVVVVNISKDTVLLSNNGSFEGVKDVTNVSDLNIGDKVTTISLEDKVTHFKSWTGYTTDIKEKTTTLKVN
jgi:hypothetical protein